MEQKHCFAARLDDGIFNLFSIKLQTGKICGILNFGTIHDTRDLFRLADVRSWRGISSSIQIFFFPISQLRLQLERP